MVTPNERPQEDRVGNLTQVTARLDFDSSYDQAGGGESFDPTLYGEGSTVLQALIPPQQDCQFVFDFDANRIKVYTLAGVEKADGADLSALTDVRATFLLIP